jgi:hypothetical protein
MSTAPEMLLDELMRDSESEQISAERTAELASSFATLLTPGNEAGARKVVPPLFLTFDIARTSTSAAEWWVNAPQTARQAIIRHATGRSMSEHAANVAAIAQSVVTLAQWANPTAALAKLSRAISNNHTELKRELHDIKKRLERIETILVRVDRNVEQIRLQMDENVLAYAYTGISHLERALNSSVNAVKNNDLALANANFSRLLVMTPERRTRGYSADMPNDALIAVGYWGLSVYYSLMDDQISALRQVYECGSKCPDFATSIFGPGFFGSDYDTPLQMARASIKDAESKLANLAAHNRKAKWMSIIKMVGVHAVGLTLGTISGAIGTVFGMTLPAGGIVYLQFVRGNPVHPDYKDVNAAVTQLTAATESLEKTRAALRKECDERLSILGQRSVLELLTESQRFGLA